MSLPALLAARAARFATIKQVLVAGRLGTSWSEAQSGSLVAVPVRQMGLDLHAVV